MPTGAVHLVPAAGWVAEATKETVRCFSLVALQTTIALPRRVIAICGSSPRGSSSHRFSAEMFRGVLHRLPRSRVEVRTTRSSPLPVRTLSVQTITAFPAETAIWGPWTSSLTGAMVTGGDQPLPGRRLLTWTRSGWPPDQVAIASPSGVTATAGAPASRLDGPTTVGEAHRGAASAAETMAIVAATTSATGTARVRRGLMNPG